jgi:hypothetical protein
MPKFRPRHKGSPQTKLPPVDILLRGTPKAAPLNVERMKRATALRHLRTDNGLDGIKFPELRVVGQLILSDPAQRS